MSKVKKSVSALTGAREEIVLLSILAISMTVGYFAFKGFSSFSQSLTANAPYSSTGHDISDRPEGFASNFTALNEVEPFTTSEEDLYYIGKRNVSGWVNPVNITPLFIVRMNGEGLRDGPFSEEKPPDTVRVLVIGDSYTFGWGVNESTRYTEWVEKWLNERSERNYQIINAGIPGWGMKDYYEFLKKRGLGYDPDIVVIAFGKSDVMSRKDSDEIVESARKKVYPNTNLSNLSVEEKYHLNKEFVSPAFRKFLNDRTQSIRDVENSSFGKYFREIQSITEEKDVPVIYYGVTLTAVSVESFMREKKLKDTTAVFNPVPQNIRYRVSGEDPHPNPWGHRYLAKGLYEILKKQGPCFYQTGEYVPGSLDC